MRLASLLLLGLSSVFAQDLTALKFNGTGVIISSDDASMKTFRTSLTYTSTGGFTAFTTVTMNQQTIRPEEQTLITYANSDNTQKADSVLRLSLVNVTSTSFQLRLQFLNGTLPSNSSLSSIFTSQVKSFDTTIVDQSFQLMYAFNPAATSSAFYRFGVNGITALHEASSSSASAATFVPKQLTWTELKTDSGKGELRFGGKGWNAAQGRVESPFYGTLEQVSFHNILFSSSQYGTAYTLRNNIAQPNLFLGSTGFNDPKFAPVGGYYQFQSSNAVLNRTTGIFTFSGAAYTTSTSTKTPIYALSYGCDTHVNAQLQYVLLGSTFTCPTPTTPTPITTDAPTSSATTAAPTTDAPTTPATTDAPTTPVTTDAPTTPATTDAPTTPAATDAPTTPATTDAPTTPATTDAPTTPVTTDAPTTPATTDAPTTPVTTDAPTTPVTTDAPTTPATTDAPTTPVTTDAPTSTPEPTTSVNVTDAPTTPTPTPTSATTPTPTNTVTDAPTPTSSTTPTPTNTVTDAPTPTSSVTDAPTKEPIADPTSSSSTGILVVNGAMTTSMPIFGTIMSIIIAALL